jgi:hypothetical protein
VGTTCPHRSRRRRARRRRARTSHAHTRAASRPSADATLAARPSRGPPHAHLLTFLVASCAAPSLSAASRAAARALIKEMNDATLLDSFDKRVPVPLALDSATCTRLLSDLSRLLWTRRSHLLWIIIRQSTPHPSVTATVTTPGAELWYTRQNTHFASANIETWDVASHCERRCERRTTAHTRHIRHPTSPPTHGPTTPGPALGLTHTRTPHERRRRVSYLPHATHKGRPPGRDFAIRLLATGA